MSKEIKKYGSEELKIMVHRFERFGDSKLQEIYLNIDWDDFNMMDI